MSNQLKITPLKDYIVLNFGGSATDFCRKHQYVNGDKIYPQNIYPMAAKGEHFVHEVDGQIQLFKHMKTIKRKS